MNPTGTSHSRPRSLAFADTVLGLAAFCGLLVVAFTLFRWATTHRPAYAVLSLVGCAASLGLGLVARRGKPDRRVGLSLSLVSISVVLYAGEFLATVLDPARSQQTPPTGAGRDSRSMYDVVRDRRDQGEAVEPFVAPSELLNLGGYVGFGFLPVGAISASATVFCNETGSWLTYLSDEHGFNNPADLWEDPEVVIVGDSFAHGMCVEPEESIAGQLRKTWPQTLTLGLGGNGPLLTLASLSEFGPELRPRSVVWAHYSGNDLDNLFVEGVNPELVRYLTPGYRQDLAGRQQAVDSALRAWVSDQYRTGSDPHRTGLGLTSVGGLMRFFRMSRLRQRLGLTQRPQYDFGLYKNILETADEMVHSWGGRLYFAFLPSYGQLAGARRTLGDPERTIQVARDLGWPIVDGRSLFEAHGLDPLRYFSGDAADPGHYTPLGYQLLSDAIRTTIEAPRDPQP